VTVERDVQPTKHVQRGWATDDTMESDKNDDRIPKKRYSRTGRRDIDSNMTIERQRQSAKQSRPSCSTDGGMQMAEMDEQFAKARFSISES
jgi:hypothetical protein